MSIVLNCNFILDLFVADTFCDIQFKRGIDPLGCTRSRIILRLQAVNLKSLVCAVFILS